MRLDVSATGSVVDTAALIGARAAAGRAQPDFAERMSRFDTLSSTVLDTSGQYSEDQRVQAYQTLQSMSVTGKLIGLDDDRRKTLDQATFSSDIGQRSQDLQRSFIQAVNTAGQSGGAAGALKASLAAFDGLSTSDQNILFSTGLNAMDRTGAKPYGDAQGWRDNTDAQLKVVSYMRDAGVIGANGALDQRAASTKAASDPQFAAALKLSLRRDNNSASWTQSVLKLFGASRTQDRVELSPEAQKAMSAYPTSVAASTIPAPQPAYRQGSIVSVSA